MTNVKPNYNMQNERLLIGCFYKNSDFFVEYKSLIKSEYDFYRSEEDIKSGIVGEMQFWYDNYETMFLTFSQDFSENKVNMFMSQDKNRFDRYKRLGGYKVIKGLVHHSDGSDFKKYLATVKKFAYLREMERIGFSTSKLRNHKDFDLFDATYIQRALLTKIHAMSTVIGGVEQSVRLGNNASTALSNWTKKPSYGVDFPFHLWNMSFRGARKKKFLVEAMLSNEGKTRKMMRIALYIAVTTGAPSLVMTNEMSEEDILSCKIITAMNLPEIMKNFDFELDKTENEIVMGLYRDENNEFLIRKFDENGDPLMEDEAWEQYLYDNSQEYQNCLSVTDWIEDNSIIYFIEMNGKYSDADIEMQIKSHVLAHKIEYVYYDTLKGFKTDGWEAIKQSATRLEELMKELDIFGYANFQLTDDSIFIDIFDFTSNNLANCKQMFHVLDFLVLNKKIFPNEYENYIIMDEFGGEVPLDKSRIYYGEKIGKSRTGNKGKVIACEVDLDRNIWKEVGWMVRKNGHNSAPKQRKKY